MAPRNGTTRRLRQERSLGAVRTDHRHDTALANRQRDAVQRFYLAVRDAQVAIRAARARWAARLRSYTAQIGFEGRSDSSGCRPAAPRPLSPPKSMTTRRSVSPITKSISCSTRRIVMPSCFSTRNSVASSCFSRYRRPAAGSSTAPRADQPHARAISTMLLAERERAACNPPSGQPVPACLRGLGASAILFLAIQANTARSTPACRAGRRARRCRAPTWSVSAGHAGGQYVRLPIDVPLG